MRCFALLWISLLAPVAAQAQGIGPDALARHFQRGDFNCYSLDPPVEGLTVTLLHHFDPDRDMLGYDETHFSYDIDLMAGPSSDPIWALGQCRTRDINISCGVACDSGQFQIGDAGIESVLLTISRLGEECPDGETRTFDRERYGRTFILSREPDTTCEELLRTIE